MATALVIENAPTWHLGYLRPWLESVDVELNVVTPHTGQELPQDPSAFDCLVALGGGRGAEWTMSLASLLDRAISSRIPTLAFCSSARTVAAAHGGQLEEVEQFRPGPRLMARRDAALEDALFGAAPMGLDVVWWRHEELVALPPDAALLVASPYGSPEVFRIGDRFWGIQSHVELDAEMVTNLGGGEELAAKVEAMGEYLSQTWRPIVRRFGEMAAGRGTPAPLKLLDQ